MLPFRLYRRRNRLVRTYGQIKSWVDNRRTNGLAEFDAIYRVRGNKFMVDVDAFDRWLASRMAER